MKFRREDGEQYHLLGLRDFTDQASLARLAVDGKVDASADNSKFSPGSLRTELQHRAKPMQLNQVEQHCRTVFMLFDMDLEVVQAPWAKGL